MTIPREAMEAGARGPCGLKKMDTGADAILENQEVLYLGTQLPHAAQAAAESSNSWGEPENGFWSTEDDGSCIWSQDFGDGDYFHEDASGVFWSWNHSHKDDLGDLPPEQQREIEDAFSAAEAKVGSFTQARQAVKAKSLSRGFFRFNPHMKGRKGKGKGFGKPKGKGKGSAFGPRPAPPVLYQGEAFAVGPGDPGFTGWRYFLLIFFRFFSHFFSGRVASKRAGRQASKQARQEARKEGSKPAGKQASKQ